MPYNPFDKPIGEKLAPEDLQQLISRRVAEGYTVEYKSGFQENPKIGRSIASFANTYGGWYFVGVEAQKPDNIATDICGFSLNDTPDPIDKIREIVKSHIDPVPVFHPQIVNLEKAKAVLVVYIPGEQETPFITRDGRVYRRKGDSSDPVPETDRYAFDRLIDNGREGRKRFEEFCEDDRVFSEAEEQAWVKIFLSPYPLGSIGKFQIPSEKVIEELLELSRTPIEYGLDKTEVWGFGSFPFDFGRPTPSSIILEQVNFETLAYNSTTAELFRDGRAKFFIVLNHRVIQQKKDINSLKSLKVQQVFNDIWGDGSLSALPMLRLIDIGELFGIAVNLLSYYREWLGEEASLTDIKIAIKFENVSLTVPFFDLDEWAAHVEKLGLPLVRQDTISIPRNPRDANPVRFDNRYDFWIQVVGLMGLAFHLPTALTYRIFQEERQRSSTPIEKWTPRNLFPKKSKKEDNEDDKNNNSL